MYLEKEMYYLLPIGFSFIIGSVLIFLIILYVKEKNRKIFFFIFQLVFLVISFYYFYMSLLNYANVNHVMYSEQQTIYILQASGFWMLSMICMVLGIFRMIKPK